MSAFTLSLIEKERERKSKSIELISSANFISDDVRKAIGSCMIDTYTRGYPAMRPLGRCGRACGGCEHADEIENFCCDLWKSAFKTDYHVNVQPYSGSNANLAAYLATVEPGETILMQEPGTASEFLSKVYHIEYYGLDERGFVNYDAMEEKANALRPRLIVAGSPSCYRKIDFGRIAEIAGSVFAYFMVDMSHIAGLVVAGEHSSPFGLADIITTSTSKTLRGPHGGLVFCKPGWAKKVDAAVSPGIQGAPSANIIAGKTVAGEEACRKDFRTYIHDAVHNGKSMAKEFKRLGYNIVGGGTDIHVFALDLTKLGLSGKLAQETLDANNISVSKCLIPNDPRSPLWTSGLRIGAAAMTTAGWQAIDFMRCADDIDEIITQKVVSR